MNNVTTNQRSWILALLCVALSAASMQALADSCDLERGAKAATKCTACHALDSVENRVGPSLLGVVGRKIASYEGFRYSRALRQIDGTWSEAQLDRFLRKPQEYARGTSMAFGGLPKEQERADIICFLGGNNRLQ